MNTKMMAHLTALHQENNLALLRKQRDSCSDFKILYFRNVVYVYVILKYLITQMFLY